MNNILNTRDIFNIFLKKYENGEFRTIGNEVQQAKTLEIQNAHFEVDKPWIVRKPNYEYYINPLIFIGKDYSHLQVPHKGGCKYCALESQKESLHKPIEYYINILNEKFPQFNVIKHNLIQLNLIYYTHERQAYLCL